MAVSKGFNYLDDAMKEACLETLASGQYYLGPQNDNFEKEVAEFLDVKHAIAVNSGTTGMFLILQALGLEQDDEILVPAMGFVTLAEAPAVLGMRARFCEVETTTYNLDPERLDEFCTDRVKALVPAHNYGHPADMDAIMDFARKNSLRVIEDCAHSFGAKYRGQCVGTLGDAGFLSFAGKGISVCGLGGMVVTDDDDIAQEIRLLRDHGRPRSQGVRFYEILRAGYNVRLSELHAAIGRVQLPHLPDWNARRRDNASRYNSALEKEGVPVTCPTVSPDVEHAFLHYTIRVDASVRDDLSAFLQDRDIRTSVLYPTELFLLPPYSEAWGHQSGDFPVSEMVTREILSLPNHPGLSGADIREVVQAVVEFFDGNR